MNRYLKAVLWAIPPIIFLVIIPRLALDRLPQSLVNDAAQYANISIPNFVTGLNILGLALAALSAVQSWSYKWSIIKPVSSSLHMITSFVLMLYIIGIGNPYTYGVTSLTLTGLGGSSTAFTLNLTLTFLALMVGIAVVLKIVQKSMKYREDVINHRLDLTQPGSIGVMPVK